MARPKSNGSPNASIGFEATALRRSATCTGETFLRSLSAAKDNQRLGELIDVIATIELTAASEGEKTHRSVDLLGRVYSVLSPDWLEDMLQLARTKPAMPWGEVVDEVLHPGEVGVALGRDAELPAHGVVFQS